MYCSGSDIRTITGLTTTDINDVQFGELIMLATAQLNADIQTTWDDEKVSCISAEKENKIDGSNKTYYTVHFPIGDRNNDSTLSGIDVYAYTLDANSTRSQVIVTTLDDSEKGKLTLASSPDSSQSLYFSYKSSPLDMETPHDLIKMACAQLTAALAFTRLNVRKIDKFKVGKISVMKQSSGFDNMLKQYYYTINRIRSKIFKVGTSENTL